jgi:AcrR family transcriptional regulator
MARPRVHDDALRDRLVASAAQVVAGKGADGISLRALAEECGTSTSAVYSIFGSKEALVDAVVAEADNSFSDSQRSALARPSSGPVQSLALLGLAYRRWALDHPALYAVMFARDGSIATTDLLAAGSIAPLRTVVQECFDAGIFAPGPSVGDVVLSIWAGVHGFVSLEIGQLRFPSKRAADRCYRAHLAAIAQSWQGNRLLLGARSDG